MNSEQSLEMRRQLDRLIDGELSEKDYRELLERLEQEPDGWRNCAMAFLESQALERELGSLLEDSGRRGEVVTSVNVARRSSLSHTAGLLIAIAASFTVAFAGSLWWQSLQPRKPTNRPINVAERSEEPDGRSPIAEATTPQRQSTPTRLIRFVPKG